MLAAKDRRKKTLTLVCTNTTAEPKDVEFTMEGLKLKGQVRQIRTSGRLSRGEHWAESDLPKVKGYQLNVTLAPNSVTTFQVRAK